MALRIPTKSLEDNFKLNDFQKDFTDLMELALFSLAKPKRIDFTRMNGMDVMYDNGKIVSFGFERRGQQITKIINLTDNKETTINY